MRTANEEITRCIDLPSTPIYPSQLLAAASVCHDLREYQAAVPVLKLYIKLKPDDATAHVLLARSYVALGRPARAIPTLEHALNLDTDLREARSLLLWCYTALTDEQYKTLESSETAY